MTKILLDPVDFDALHLSALAFGGIGAGATFEEYAPVCVTGHAEWLDGGEKESAGYPESGPCVDRFMDLGLEPWANDAAVWSVTQFKYGARVPFKDYIKLLNIDIQEGD